MTEIGHRAHGGDIDVARKRFNRADMVDLSTGISPIAYPASAITAAQWQALPTKSALDACLAAARKHYAVPDDMDICVGPGSQALLQNVPFLAPPGPVWIETPTYNEHAPAWAAAGHEVTCGDALSDRVRHAVLVLPNNPMGTADHDKAKAVAEQVRAGGGMLLIDGAFACGADEARLLGQLPGPHIVHLRSFGKFFGMAGLRLGFAIGDAHVIARLGARIGPWPVNNAALQISRQAFEDTAWADHHRNWLATGADRLAALLSANGFCLAGGTILFQTLRHATACDLHQHLAQHAIWARVYDEYPDLLRLGIPGDEATWHKLEMALAARR
jgi:cobalamin biosynthetic protein CobC